ncbi:adenine deaminase [Pichia californica]|uniref:Adenine deaminase n=1 Tax=Pichia californica TaxID=460514 RepID=A0A9P7BG56_9ASCO|nr:adenine deaminase [[Candida] californica]KAG0688820.1 adenine deaminase [[Candida] californica]
MSCYKIAQHKHDFLHELPKCEHHVHLEGTLSPDLLFKLAKRNNITLPNHFPSSIELCNDRYEQFADLQDFLDHYYIGMSVLIQEKDFEDLAYEYFIKAKNDGLHHSETFFDPQGHVERGIPIETVVNGFNKACIKAQKELGVSTKLIMCLLRHLPSANGLATIESAKPFYENGIIHGLGLDSSEKPFPPKLFIDCYSEVKKNFPEVGLTAHAGEEADPIFISDSLDLLNVTRIDHGVQSYRDDELLKRLAKEQIMLSLCPLSNVKLQVVNDVSELPIRKWMEFGVPFSINSDDPAYFGGYILDNYLAVESRFNFSGEEWVKIAKNSVNGSWIDAARKKELIEEIDRVYNKYKDLI